MGPAFNSRLHFPSSTLPAPPAPQLALLWAFAGAPERRVRRLTRTLHALVHQPVEQGTTVVAEGGAAVAVQTELVLVPGILGWGAVGRSRSEEGGRRGS